MIFWFILLNYNEVVTLTQRSCILPIVITLVFNALSIGSGLVAAVLLCMKREHSSQAKNQKVNFHLSLPLLIGNQ